MSQLVSPEYVFPPTIISFVKFMKLEDLASSFFFVVLSAPVFFTTLILLIFISVYLPSVLSSVIYWLLEPVSHFISKPNTIVVLSSIFIILPSDDVISPAVVSFKSIPHRSASSSTVPE